MLNDIKVCDNKDLPYAFISYSHNDANIVYPILKQLQDNGYRFWYDQGIVSGTKWADYISDWLTHENCTNFVVFISKNSVRSENVQDEIHLARKYKKSCLVIYLEDVKLTGGIELQLDRWQSIKWSKSQESISMQMLMKGISADRMEILFSDHVDTHIETIETTFQKIINELFDDTTLYRDALRNGNQEVLFQANSAMNEHLQKLFYFCEKHKYFQEYQSLINKGNDIIAAFNSFVPYYNVFSQFSDRMSEEAQKWARMTEDKFREFIDSILQAIPTSPSTHIEKIDEIFQRLINELFDDTTLYRDALRNGNQKALFQANSAMNEHLQKLFYFCEKHKYFQEYQSLINKGNDIIAAFNSFVPYYNTFSQSSDRMSEEAQNSAKIADKFFSEFVNAISRAFKM
ncbi:MAG: toll/interleukin-1 receptor domain-containing protein [Lachnospiraceae bacterium]